MELGREGITEEEKHTCERGGRRRGGREEEWPAAVCLTSPPDQCQCHGSAMKHAHANGMRCKKKKRPKERKYYADSKSYYIPNKH